METSAAAISAAATSAADTSPAAASAGTAQHTAADTNVVPLAGTRVVPLFPLLRLTRPRMHFALLAVLLASGMTVYGMAANPRGEAAPPAFPPPIPESMSHDYILLPSTSYVEGNELPARLRYREVDREKLQDYLAGRQSLLRQEPYFTTILDTAREFDIHPLLLFAITGQEQAFVPDDHPQADRIVNNPFNVYHSWQDFNTTTAHSAAVASRTIIRLSQNRPAGIDPVEWINREYAEDPLWHRGVNSLFAAMERYIAEGAEQRE